MKKTYGLTILLLMMCVAMPVFGGVLAWPGINPILPPLSVVPGALENDALVTGFRERMGYQLPTNIAVDVTGLGPVTNPASLTPGLISLGTFVDVYYLHFDPSTNTGTIGPRTGSITIAEKILGIQILNGTLNSGNVLGYPLTAYSNVIDMHGLEAAPPTGGVGDSITVGAWTLGGGQTVSFSFYVTNANPVDPADDIRIIVQGIPEPATGLLLLPGLAALEFLRRRRRTVA